MVADGCRLVGDDERSLAGTGRRWIESEREEVWCVESAYNEIHFGICIVDCFVLHESAESMACVEVHAPSVGTVSHTRTVADAEVGIDRTVQVSIRWFGTGPRTSISTLGDTSDH